MGRVQGKIAIITGAGSGVGRACMRLFAREGATIVGVGRTQASLDETLTSVRAEGGDGIVVRADLTHDDGGDKVVAETLDRYGRVDILVHAAGVGYSWQEKSPGSMNAVDETTPGKWREVIGLDLDAAYLIARAVIPPMRAQGRGSIVMVTSAAAERGMTDAHAYASAKAGVNNLVRSMAMTYVKDGIRANCLAPGPINTPMIASIMGLFDDPATATLISPMGRAGTPEEMANGCLFLASDEASFCTGAILAMDGGISARL
jgi:NAD(P)-dependent dehydrogenase (short-subunit alcohol dehydrogenase family)